MSEENKTIARRIIEDIWNKKNPDIIEDLYDKECDIHTPEGLLRGPKGCRQLYDTYMTAFPDGEFFIEDIVAEGDKVAAFYRFTGTHKGTLMDVTPTGKQVTVKGVSFCLIDQGKVRQERAVWDTLSMMEQLGAVPVHHHAWQ